jgi:uncharacterized membrane protein YeaQ/YmgE (transglycosylase-associated protein family)
MSIVWMIVIGFVVGLLARAIKPGDDRMGILMTILLGIAGSFLAGLAGQQLGVYAPGEPAGFIASVIGAIVVLVLYGIVRNR